ncbi:MAG: hypothetical protein OXU40_06195 [Nitrospira sp.]|nr:hypothetical protein [Nitrospira sp.]
MSELYFRVGDIEGFTSIKLADKQENCVTPIRELVQNSLDASRKAGNTTCQIDVYIETIRKKDIPCIEPYEKVLEKAITTQKTKNSYNENAKQTVRGIKDALKQDTLPVLMFVDNGEGMRPSTLEGLLDERSTGSDEQSSGSFGVGHLSSYSLSSLRYVLYATKYKDGNGPVKTLFSGSPILAGYEDTTAHRNGKGRILKEKPRNELKPDFVFPEEFPSFIQPRMDALKEKGSLVAILGLSEEWSDEADYAIVSNFFHAIFRGGLRVTVHEDSRQRTISDDDVERLITDKKDNKRATGGRILSGEAVKRAWEAVGGTDTRKTIKLKNSETVHVFITNDDYPKSVIILVRNGMVIARHDNMLSSDLYGLRQASEFKPFTAVIDVDRAYAPELFRLVKGAESPYHSQLQTKRLSKEDEQCLKKLWKELSEEIKKHLQMIERDSFDLPLFPLPGKAEVHLHGGSRSSGQDLDATSQRRPPRPPDSKVLPSPDPVPDRKKRPKPDNINRNLEAKSAVRYTDQDDKWEVRLRVRPEKQKDARDDVYLSICVGEDNDKEQTRIYLKFMAVTIDGTPIQVPADETRIKLDHVKQVKPYDIVAEVAKPDEIGDMKVALLPIFGLKQRKKSEG